MLAYTVSKIQRYIGRKLRIFLKSTDHFYFPPPFRVLPSNFVTALWLKNAKVMMELPGREKVKCLMIPSAISIQCTSVTDRRTDRHRTTAGTVLCIAPRGKTIHGVGSGIVFLLFLFKFSFKLHVLGRTPHLRWRQRRLCVRLRLFG